MSKEKIDTSKLDINELFANPKFINFAIKNKLVPPIEDDEEKIIDNFRPDEAFKYTFKNIEAKYIIRMINDVCNTNYSEDSKIHFASTEFVGTTGDTTKRKVIGDMALVIDELEKLNPNEITNTIIIEFQSSEDEDMPIRIHVYAFNHTTEVVMDTNFIKNDVIEKVKKKVQIYPHTIVIYTTLNKKEKYGQEEFNFSFPKFQVNGIDHTAINGDVVTQVTPYINILKLSLEEITDSTLSFLQFFYLYKFKKDIDLIKSEQILKIFDKMEENLKKFKGNSNQTLTKIYSDLIEDLYVLMRKDKPKFEKELECMEYIRETFFDRRCNEIEQKVRRETEEKFKKETIREVKKAKREAKKETIREVKKAKREAEEETIREVKKAKREAEEEKEKNVILRMLKMINSSEEIHQLTGFPLSQINDIRNEHSL